MSKNIEYVSGKKAKEMLGVSDATLRRWDEQQNIKTVRMPGGKRLYNVKEFLALRNPIKSENNRRKICYCRVSSAKQSDDLQRQIKQMSEEYPDTEIISDIGSGINWKRSGLRKIIKYAQLGDVEEVIIFHKDRLCRFAYELLEYILSLFNTRIVVLDRSCCSSTTDELSKDLLSIVQVFCCRENGKRRYKTRADASKEDKNKTESTTD
jgi:putative resolvase